MVKETHPSTFAELVSISGLSHGTDVWLGNAAELVRKGIPLSGCICCRDDIMNYLILQGVKPKLSFKTMESVRKGKGLTEEMETAMNESSTFRNGTSIPARRSSTCSRRRMRSLMS